jgi:hypothetical protein
MTKAEKKKRREQLAINWGAGKGTDWNFFNAYGRLRIILVDELGHDAYPEITDYVDHISPVEAEKIIKSERQIARHAMIIKLTRL